MDFHGGFNGLSWGANTRLRVRNLQGLGLPPLRTADQPRAGLHGSWGNVDLLDTRQVVIDLIAWADTPADLDDLLASIGQAMAPRSDLQPLWLDNARKLLWVRPRDASWERSYELRGRAAEVTLRFDALDPLIYAAQPSTLSASLSGITGGLYVPMLVPMTLSPAGLNEWVVTNDGTVEIWPTVTVQGPASNLWLESLTADRWLKLDLAMSATDQLVVDFAARTVTLDGVNRTGSLVPGSRWWPLLPGANTIRIRSDATAGVTVTWTWRSAWLTL